MFHSLLLDTGKCTQIHCIHINKILSLTHLELGFFSVYLMICCIINEYLLSGIDIFIIYIMGPLNEAHIYHIHNGGP